MSLFTVNVTSDDESWAIHYDSVEEFFEDAGLRVLFDDGLVTECEVIDCDGKRIAKPPIMVWNRLVDQMVLNSESILRKKYR